MPNDAKTTTTLDAERADLLAALAKARAALIATTSGLDDGQAAARPTVSELCLGGLVKHVTAVEEGWLGFVVDGPVGMSYDLPDGVTWADVMAGTAREYPEWMIEHREGFRMRPGETLAGVVERYERVAARTAEVVAAIPDLSVTHPLPDAPWHEPAGGVLSARGALLHVLAETTQHAGHADILRETLDARKPLGA
ncbi:DinB family protein [Actinokineospora spheciospongiae]|uniref:DinB family protein n=1 Tax=Actinokineospora spheciospongiae TaxID=909613 RepID=UPI000D7150F2|nr:DinB family protein [Actinokineospora spheciospongiae]PWW53063.1 uncharacterized protein DUF664 [Actinokineospora spheciospongiae]